MGVGLATAAATFSTPPDNSVLRPPERAGGPAPAQLQTIAASANAGRGLRRGVGKRRENDGPQEEVMAQP